MVQQLFTERLDTARLTGVAVVGTAFAIVGAIPLTAGDSLLMRLVGLFFLTLGVCLVVWTLWGHEAVTLTGHTLNIEAQIGSRTIARREYNWAEISNLRVDRVRLARARSASGLPFAIGAWDPRIWFDYGGRRLGFGESLVKEQDAQDFLARLMASSPDGG